MLPYYITTLLPYYITTLLHYYLTTLLPYYITTLLHYYLTTLLPYYAMSTTSEHTSTKVEVYKLNVAVVGAPSVGKTTLIRRITTGDYNKNYVPTTQIESTQLVLYTNYGRVLFTLTEFGGSESLYDIGNFRDSTGNRPFDAVFIVYDVHDRQTYELIEKYLQKELGTMVAVLGNKCDLSDKRDSPSRYAMQLNCTKFGMKYNKNVVYYDVSARSNMGLEDPFLYLATNVIGKEDVELVEAPCIFPPEVILTDEQRSSV